MPRQRGLVAHSPARRAAWPAVLVPFPLLPAACAVPSRRRSFTVFPPDLCRPLGWLTPAWARKGRYDRLTGVKIGRFSSRMNICSSFLKKNLAHFVLVV